MALRTFIALALSLTAAVTLVGCGGGSSTSPGTIPKAPVIATQPANQTVPAGQAATFSVTATGTPPLSYQWQKNGAPIGGATGTSYTTPGTTFADNGSQFFVVVSNSTGIATSNTATLTVNAAPFITTQPTNQTVAAGQTATFTVVATGAPPLSYQWQKNGTVITGATGASYTTPTTTSADNGSQFIVVVSNSTGNATSNAAILTVNTPPVITTQPANQTVAAGQTATFTVAATGTPPLSYQWQKNGAAITGATGASYTTSATTFMDNGAQFVVVVSNSIGSATSTAATLTVNAAPIITTQPANQYVAAGQTATFTVAATGTLPLGYQWKENGAVLAGATGASYTTPPTTASDNGSQFSVVISNAFGSITSSSSTLSITTAAAIQVLTYHNDSLRSGLNSNEIILAPSVVNSTQFGQLFSQPVDGIIVGQPLYLSGVNIPNLGIHNVVYVATQHDSIYAFDADNNSGTNASPLWQVSFIDPNAGITTVPGTVQKCSGVTGFTEIGIESTPAIDPNTNTLYLVAKTEENGVFVHRLHALDVATGQEKFGGPVSINASYTANDGKVTQFSNLWEMNRPGLLLLNGAVYLTFGTNGCDDSSQGWVLTYDAGTLQQIGVFDAAPDAGLAGIWQSGQGPAADSSGNVYFSTAEVTFDANTGGQDYGSSIVKLTQGTNLTVTDYFTPSNWSFISMNDLDLSSCGVMALPDQTGTHPHELIASGKQGTIYVIDRDNMGQFNMMTDQVIQELPLGAGAMFSSPAYFNNTVYFAGLASPIYGYPLSGGMLGTPLKTATMPGGIPSISANGTSNGVLWIITGGVLEAFDASSLSRLYTSLRLPNTTHFVIPTVANGKVYVGTTQSLLVYGLLP